MMKIKTSELSGVQLDWAVAKCEGHPNITGVHPQGRIRIISGQFFNPASDWAHGGPIIEREQITTEAPNRDRGITMRDGVPVWLARLTTEGPFVIAFGPTPLIAAMRCYVASKLGEEVDIPEELK